MILVVMLLPFLGVFAAVQMPRSFLTPELKFAPEFDTVCHSLHLVFTPHRCEHAVTRAHLVFTAIYDYLCPTLQNAPAPVPAVLVIVAFFPARQSPNPPLSEQKPFGKQPRLLIALLDYRHVSLLYSPQPNVWISRELASRVVAGPSSGQYNQPLLETIILRRS